MRKIIFISIMLIIASIISIDAQANTKNTTVNNFSDPDFNFPQDVAKRMPLQNSTALCSLVMDISLPRHLFNMGWLSL